MKDTDRGYIAVVANTEEILNGELHVMQSGQIDVKYLGAWHKIDPGFLRERMVDRKNQLAMSVKWLERAIVLLDSLAVEREEKPE